ncbi:MAG TPA: neuromedin U [Nitrospiraceae bacterium]|nr:neuromedin U [Nitrospiraceae bacterium]
MILTLLCGAHTYAEQNAEELAKKTQNPVADLISVPFQNNLNFGLGPHNRVQNILNIQPVVPFNLTENLNLITRTIAPIIRQPDLTQDSGDTNGLGDINISLFFSPAKSGQVIWGLGPILQFPTATDEVLGTRKWSAGPTGVALTMQGPWVVGALANQIWSYAGNDDRDKVSAFLFQYFINYNFKGGLYLTSAPIITANWKATSGNKWVIPFGGGIGKVFRIGKMPLNAQTQAFYNVQQTTFGPDWTLRLQVQFLFPK